MRSQVVDHLCYNRIMADKIINTFQQRRQLQQAFAALDETRTEAELIAAARAIVHQFPADLVLATLLTFLDTPKSQIRGGLGHVAALLPPDETTVALQNEIANRRNSSQSRITAAVLLERFLGHAVPAGIISDLQDTNEVAFQSLREAIEEAARNRTVLLDYVTQLRQTEPAVAVMVMDLLARLPATDHVPLLRLIAQDDRPEVAGIAIQRLVTLGDTDAAWHAARALHTLRFALPPEVAEQAARGLRKLQFGGTVYHPPETIPWRALVGPADPGGNQSVWFVRHTPGAEGLGTLLGLVVNSRAGILQMFAGETIPREHLPPAHGQGEFVVVNVDAGQPATMLETAFDYGRWLVQQALQAHWQGKAVTALPGEHKLYGDLLWEYAAPQIDPAVAAYFAPTPSSHGDATEGVPDPALTGDLIGAAEALLAMPIMQNWLRRNPILVNMLELPENRLPNLPVDVVVRRMLAMLAQWEGHRQLTAALAAGLRAQAAWFHCAGDRTNAQHSRQLADAMAQVPVTENPLLAAILAAGLEQQRDNTSA